MAKLQINYVSEVPCQTDAADNVVDLIDGLDQDFPAGSINVKFVDDATMQALNKEYSGKDEATDVLSFSYIENGGEPIEGCLGEMVISTETAERQGAEAWNPARCRRGSGPRRPLGRNRRLSGAAERGLVPPI